MEEGVVLAQLDEEVGLDQVEQTLRVSYDVVGQMLLTDALLLVRTEEVFRLRLIVLVRRQLSISKCTVRGISD